MENLIKNSNLFIVELSKDEILQRQKYNIEKVETVIVDSYKKIQDAQKLYAGRQRESIIREANELMRFAQIAISSMKTLHEQERELYKIDNEKIKDVLHIRIE